jgi:hypothetical protein
MSMNIAFVGRRQITVHATGKTETQSKYIDVWQTPTSATYKIEESEDPIAAYCDWVISRSEDEEIKVFEDYDKEVRYELTGECDPADYTIETYNAGKEHVENFLAQVESMRNDGYEITAEVW